jgi:RimJ/RimL family protein N-acetyltransferase
LGDIEQINLTVVAGNRAAGKLYEKFGFVSLAHEKNALKWKGKYFAEEQMVLFLNKNNQKSAAPWE